MFFLQNKLLVYLDCFILRSDVTSWLLLRINLTHQGDYALYFGASLRGCRFGQQKQSRVCLDCFILRSDVHIKILLRIIGNSETSISIPERHCEARSNLGFAFRVWLDCFLLFLQNKLLVYLDCFVPRSDVTSWLLLRPIKVTVHSIPKRHCEVVALDNRSNLGLAIRV